MVSQIAPTDDLIASCQGLVRSEALRILKHLPPQVELDDLIGYGQIGLLEAAQAFDATRGIQFSTFAYYRIRGAIYDGIGKMSWGKRRPRPTPGFAQAANDLLEESAGHTEDSSLSQQACWFRELACSLSVAYVLNDWSDDGDEDDVDWSDPTAESPAAIATHQELATALKELVSSLPQQAAQLIQCTYYDGGSLQDAAQQLGISRSWASRLHAQVLQSLADGLRRRELMD